jgi:hypothetical protein
MPGIGVVPAPVPAPVRAPVPRSAALTTRAAVAVPDVALAPDPGVATITTLSPTAKLLALSDIFLVPNCVEPSIVIVTVWPFLVRMVQLVPSIAWMVARNASRPFARPPAACPVAGPVVGTGVGVAVAAPIDIPEVDDVSDAVTAAPTPQAVIPATRMTATTPAAIPDATG